MLQRRWFIGNFSSAFHDALPRRDGADGAELIKRTGRGAVGFDIIVGRAHGLPKSGQVWFAVRHARNAGGGLAGGGNHTKKGGRANGGNE